MSASSFSELGVSAAVVEALLARGITDPFKIQELVMRDAMAGSDVLAKSQTGSGKTLAFAIPIVERLDPNGTRPGALVLVPTRELAVQVTGEFEAIAAAKGLRATAVYGGVGLVDQARRASKAHILIATPGRLEDLNMRKMVGIASLGILVLDEADRMLDMGFQPQVDRIVRRIPKDRQTMFFSATLDGEVGRLARSYTRDPVLHEVESPKQTVEEVEHKFVPVLGDGKVQALIDLLSGEKGRVLVFVRTKRGADRLAHKLRQQGIRAAAMHGDLNQAAREKALAGFDSGKVDTLVATDVAARGLDLDGITHVVNFDPPADHKDYVHRVGRTARAGRSGTGITLVMPDQEAEVSRLAARLELREEFEMEGMKSSAPSITYSSHRGRNSLLGRRRRRAV